MATNIRRITPLALLLLVSSAPGQSLPDSPGSGGLAVGRNQSAEVRGTWMSDNGNGTFTNPLFYDEFSDPDVIRVGDDYYMTGTTMHAMPGLPVLHSLDLVNWDFCSYAAEKLDLGPACRLEDGKNIYGRGFWAPSFRYHNGRFFIFSNVNGYATQVYTATQPTGPWTHNAMNVSLHDLSVLFDDDGKVYVVWGYDEIRIAELTEDLTDLRPGTEKLIFPRGSGAGEGSHLYKIGGKYFITMTNWDPVCYQVCARSEKITGPYELTVISAGESFGLGTGWRVGSSMADGQIQLSPPREGYCGCMSLHQGGIVQTQTGEWWALTMMDHNSIGRLTCLSPVTWEQGWPYLGLAGNLTRSPLTWIKPRPGSTVAPHAPYERSDDFSGSMLKPIWQWNHVRVDKNWSLTNRKGYLTLRSLPAQDFWQAKNSLTQRAIGPESVVTTELDGEGLHEGDVAGLALLNYPYTWMGITREQDGYQIRQFDQSTNQLRSKSISGGHLWLRAHSDFDAEWTQFSFSTDGKIFQDFGDTVILAFQLKTFQGVRYALFNYNINGAVGGTAAFNDFTVFEPRPCGLTTPIPYGESIRLTSRSDSSVLVNWKNCLRPDSARDTLARSKASLFKVTDRGNGRIALQSELTGGFVTVAHGGAMSEVRIAPNAPGEESTFQWEDMQRGDIMLLSLKTHRYLCVDPHAGSLCAASSPGASPDRKNGSCFSWVKATK